LAEVNVGLPFFTKKDPDITHGESKRDPLGLLPIWSTVGHALIPGLATTVSRIDGIQGILFIFSCLHELPRKHEREVSDDGFLGFLERLWEYHLNELSKSPCFGSESLGAIDFQLSAARGGIVSTGLRQYYRGTCINKRVLAPDLRTLNEPYRSLATRLLEPSILRWIKTKLPEMASPDFSISASKTYSALREPLVQFSNGNAELWLSLEKHFINDNGQRPWIEYVISEHNELEKPSIPQLVLTIQEHGNRTQDSRLVERCQRILDCEPFIRLLQSVFLITQEESRNSLPKLASQLANSAPDDLPSVCRNFQRLSIPSRRLAKLKKLADLLLLEEYENFLREFLSDYYAGVCKERGKNPIVLVDGSEIIALKLGKSGNSWQNSTKFENWENGYFVKSQISLHTDLMRRMEKAS
jgi:hypothetical protein